MAEQLVYPDHENDLLIENGDAPIVLPFHDNEVAWDMAKDAVFYPVRITNAYFKQGDEFVNANGKTNTGRDKKFNLVLVDKERRDEWQAIATVTGQYATLPTVVVYDQLQEQMEELDEKYHLHTLYVSGNGGVQMLTLRLPQMRGMVGDGPLTDELVLQIVLETSVDGTRAHTISMNAFDPKNRVSFSFHGGEYRLKARHTQTVGERVVNFIPTIRTIVENWNRKLVPMMKFMYEDRFDRNQALEILMKLAQDSTMGERHRTKLRQFYETDGVSSKTKEDSMYRVAYAINEYIDTNIEERPELQKRFKESIAKNLERMMTQRGFKSA